jgi:CTP synthase (UTP-ammonia lyase)
VRNVLGFREAEHQESNPTAPTLAITALSCSLVGQEHAVRLLDGSRAQSLYGTMRTTEDYYCNYGVNEGFVPLLDRSGLRVSGRDDEGDVRVVELENHPFFIGTLFLPQTRSTSQRPHPILKAFEKAVHEVEP